MKILAVGWKGAKETVFALEREERKERFWRKDVDEGKQRF